MQRGDLETFWKRTNALNPNNIAKILYSEEIVKRVRNDLKDETGIYFQMEDVADSLCVVIKEKVEFPPKPRLRIKRKAKPKTQPVIERLSPK